MKRYVLLQEARYTIRRTTRIGRFKRMIYRSAIKDITDAAVEAWPNDFEHLQPVEFEQKLINGWHENAKPIRAGIKQRLRANNDYSSVWFVILLNLISLIVQILIDRFTEEDGRITEVTDH